VLPRKHVKVQHKAFVRRTSPEYFASNEGNVNSALKATTADGSEIFAETYPEITTDLRGSETDSTVN
jgi:hypothetical protein